MYHATQLTNPTELSPSRKANSSLAAQEIPRILWNQKFHFRIQNIVHPVPLREHPF
jgi:hypothetical protein